MKKVFIESYGCSANAADSEIMAGVLKEAGFEIVNSSEESDVNVLNTCVVKTPTEQRMIYRIKELTKLNRPLVVAGCMTKTEKNIVEKLNPRASMIGPDSVEKIAEVIDATVQRKKVLFTDDLRKPKVCLPKIRRNPITDIIPIAIGCLSSCSYCEVKFARGKLFSYPVEAIVKETKQAVSNGCRELWITSQDNSCYGKDINTNLPELLNEICKIEGKFFVRVGMVNPLHVKSIANELIESYKNEKIYKFLHLPVQSGSNRILELMNRNYSVKDFLEIVEKFKNEFPQLTLATDAIVGFPTETEEEFEETVELVKKIRPDIVNISKFGARPRTEAAKMQQLDKKIVNERSEILHRLVKQIGLENNKKWIGWKGEMLVDEKIKNGFVGRNFAYKPIIIKTKENIFGKIFNVEVVNATSNCLITNDIIK
jgi:MiaB-like tRNA modifying enzyme